MRTVGKLFAIFGCIFLSAIEIRAWSFAGQSLASQKITPSSSSSSRLLMRVPVLEDWKVLTNGRIQGTIKNHPSIPDGDIVTTSPIAQPNMAAPKRIVTTGSGSKYQLGAPQKALNNNSAGAPQISISELQRRAKRELDLTGEVVGDDTRQYLLSGRPTKSTSGKSKIYKAYRADEDGLPTGEPLTVKISNNWEAIDREDRNYAKITKSGFARGQFVQLLDFLPTASVITKKFKSQSALVMERGKVDLRKYIFQTGALQGKELRDAAAAATQCLQAVHLSGLVWTDMKAENFVVTEAGVVKGIDLESAMPVHDNPVDYSPEATPPEFARAFLAGDGPYFELEYNYDMWSLGMLLFEMSVGTGYWNNLTPMKITKALKAGPEIELDNVDIDPKLLDLIKQCLQNDPGKRPNIAQVLLHPYFLTTGIGPWSFL